MALTGLVLITVAVVGWLIACDNEAPAMAARVVARARGRLRVRRVPAARVDGEPLREWEQADLNALEAFQSEHERRGA